MPDYSSEPSPSDLSGTSSCISQELPAGYVLGEFRITGVLGSGGFGITYLADDTSLDRKVVIKENLPIQVAFRDTYRMTVLPRDGGDESDVYEWSIHSFLQEARMLASLDHPNIVKIIRTFAANGTAYFVMPFIEGDSLDSIARFMIESGKRLPESYVNMILESLLGALAYLHSRNILHRDIKPANILVVNRNTPLLIDFGCAREQSGAKSLTVIESAGYTPFEQMQTHGHVGPWSDLYALGATMYKIITGVTPPKCADRIRTDSVRKLASDEELLQVYSSRLLESIDKAMMPFEEDRFQTAQEWSVFLHGDAVGLPPQPEAPEPLSVSGEPDLPPVPPVMGQSAILPAPASAGSRKKGGVVVCAAAAVLLVGGIMMIMYSSEENSEGYREENHELPDQGRSPAALSAVAGEGEKLPLEAPGGEKDSPSAPEELAGNAGKSEGTREESQPSPLERKTPVTAQDWFDEGEVYRKGEVLFGISPDPVKSVACYKKAAGMGHEKAELYLAEAYYTGEGSPVDYAESARLFEKNAKKGVPEAQYFLASMYFSGQGLPEDEEKGMYWLKQSARQLPEAKCELARLYYESMPPKIEEAIVLLESACKSEQGAQGVMLLANLYYASEDESRNRKVLPLLTVMAEKGNPEAQELMARCYWEGKGTPRDVEKAVRWFERAALNGNADAMYMMGLHCQRKHLIDKAREYYRQAADAGNRDAEKAFKSLKQ